MLTTADVSIKDVLRYFTERSIEVSFLVPTPTGLHKGIMDATKPVRDHLKSKAIHDYDQQLKGDDHKRLVNTLIVSSTGIHKTTTSLYRPVTKDGDPRLWIYKLPKFAGPGNLLALVAINSDELLVVNTSIEGLIPRAGKSGQASEVALAAVTKELDRILSGLSQVENKASEELLQMLRRISGIWHLGRSGNRLDSEVGRLLEELLDIRANSSRAPDFKGIEIKASRERSHTRQSLFAQVPDWTTSPLKSSAEILDAFGYVRDPRYQRQLRCSMRSGAPNGQGLYLLVEEAHERLTEASVNEEVPHVAYWPMDGLKRALLAKHPETFWIKAATKLEGSRELFRYERAVHTKMPMAANLPTLLDSGVITVDHLISRNLAGRVVEKGPLFKIRRADMDLLFPPGKAYVL